MQRTCPSPRGALSPVHVRPLQLGALPYPRGCRVRLQCLFCPAHRGFMLSGCAGAGWMPACIYGDLCHGWLVKRARLNCLKCRIAKEERRRVGACAACTACRPPHPPHRVALGYRASLRCQAVRQESKASLHLPVWLRSGFGRWLAGRWLLAVGCRLSRGLSVGLVRILIPTEDPAMTYRRRLNRKP